MSKPLEMHGAPTIPADTSAMPDQLTPNDTSQDSSTQDQPTQPNQPNQSTQSQPSDQPQAGGRPPMQPVKTVETNKGNHAHWYQKALEAASGGPTVSTSVDPQTGQVTRTVNHRPMKSMGASILAGAIAGMMGGLQAPDAFNAAGTRDLSGSARAGAAAGGAVAQAPSRQAQNLSDQQYTAALATTDQNMKLHHQYLADTQLEGQNADAAYARLKQQTADTAPIIAGMDDMNKQLGQENAGEDISGSELEKRFHSNDLHVSKDAAFVVGSRPIIGSDGQITGYEPMYRVYDPTAKALMSDEIRKQYPQFAPVANGTPIPVQAFWRAYNDKQNTRFSQGFSAQLENDFKDVGLKVKPGAFDNVAKQLVKYNAAIAGLDPDEIPGALRKAGANESLINQVTSLYPQGYKAADFSNARDKDKKIAEITAKGFSSDAEALNIKNNPQFPKELRDQADEYLKGSVDQAGKKSGAEAAGRADAEANSGDIASAASNVVEGSEGKLRDFTSMRGGQRTAAFNALQQSARDRGLDPTDFSPAALEARANMYEDFRSQKSKTGQNLTAFDTFLGHANDAFDATESMRKKLLAGTGTPLLNKPLKWIAKNATNDSDYIAFSTALEPVRKEFMSFLNNNRAEHTEDLKTMEIVLNDEETPARIESALKQLSKSADLRLAGIGRKYLGTMGTTYPELVSDAGKTALQRMGVESKSLPLSQQLQRGWTGDGERKPLDPENAKMFVQAAGGDNTRAKALAWKNGWKF